MAFIPGSSRAIERPVALCWAKHTRAVRLQIEWNKSFMSLTVKSGSEEQKRHVSYGTQPIDGVVIWWPADCAMVSRRRLYHTKNLEKCSFHETSPRWLDTTAVSGFPFSELHPLRGLKLYILSTWVTLQNLDWSDGSGQRVDSWIWSVIFDDLTLMLFGDVAYGRFCHLC